MDDFIIWQGRRVDNGENVQGIYMFDNYYNDGQCVDRHLIMTIGYLEKSISYEIDPDTLVQLNA